MSILKKIVIWLIVLAILAAGGYWGYSYWAQMKAARVRQMEQASATSKEPMPMPAEKCVIQDYTSTLEFTASTEAVNSVKVRARVAGYLEEIHFEDGSLVEKGQLLFTIEPETYQSIRDEAAAKLATGKTELTRAKLDLERIEKAVGSGAVSRQDLTTAQAAYDTAKAAVDGYEAALEKAELDLSYTEVRSPIDGRISRHLTDAGNLVGAAEPTVLATIMQTKPIYVSFYMGENLLEGDFLHRLQDKPGYEPLEFFAGLPQQDDFPYKGFINYLDNNVDSRTGTIYVRGELENQSQQLLPGMFTRVKVPTAEIKDAVLVPEKAINTDLGGKFVLIVDKDNVLQRRDVQLGEITDSMRVIEEGLDGSETFIVGSFHIARPGMKIKPLIEGAGQQKKQ